MRSAWTERMDCGGLLFVVMLTPDRKTYTGRREGGSKGWDWGEKGEIAGSSEQATSYWSHAARLSSAAEQIERAQRNNNNNNRSSDRLAASVCNKTQCVCTHSLQTQFTQATRNVVRDQNETSDKIYDGTQQKRRLFGTGSNRSENWKT